MSPSEEKTRQQKIIKNNKELQISVIKEIKPGLLAGTLAFVLALLLPHLPLPPPPFLLEISLYLAAFLLIGGPVIWQAVISLRQGTYFNETLLMTIATLGAFALGEYPEGVAVMLFYTIGETLQERAVDSSKRSIKELMDIRPDYARRLSNGDSRLVDPEEIMKGELIQIRPGERVPLDGEVIKGESRLDAAALTGESLPQWVKPGDEVLSGMINESGLLTVRVSSEYSSSTVARILEMVERASSRKAPTEKFITRFAAYYTPIVVLSAMALALLPPLLLGESITLWAYRALILLVISCPCALVLSIPLSFYGGIGRASREGILVKGGNYLEALNWTRQVFYDKTGTLTQGDLKVTRVESCQGFNQDTLLEYAALAEAHSHHPLAQSIKKAYGKEIKKERISSHQELPGRGIRVEVEGTTILAGSERWLQEEGVEVLREDNPQTAVSLAVDGVLAGKIIIVDSIREEAKATISKLREMGIQQVLLTGDREEAATLVAEKLGLEENHASLLPEEKVKIMEEMMEGAKGRTLFIGDGINDAPVLARADIGVAMGGLGADAALEAADIVLMKDDPSLLLRALGTARKTRTIVWQNIGLALGVKGAVMILGAMGLVSMWAAIFADVGVALLAVLNTIRLLPAAEGVLR